MFTMPFELYTHRHVSYLSPPTGDHVHHHHYHQLVTKTMCVSPNNSPTQKLKPEPERPSP